MSRPLAWDLECWDPSDEDGLEGSHGAIEDFVRMAEAMQPRTPDDLAAIAVGEMRAAAYHIPQGAQRPRGAA